MRRVTVLVALLCVAGFAESARAQVLAGGCRPIASGRFSANNVLGMMWFSGGASFSCPGGVSVRADSAVTRDAQSRLEFIGSVRYADTTRILTADRVVYDRRQEDITALGEAALLDTKTGSSLHGAALNIFLPTETRPQELIRATGVSPNRPVAILVEQRADGTGSDTTHITADNAINITGGTSFTARSNAVITRSDVEARAVVAVYREQTGILRLDGAAQLVGEGYDLTGDTIVTETDDDGRLRSVRAWAGALLEGEEYRLIGGDIELTSDEDGEVESIEAVGDADLITRQSSGDGGDQDAGADSTDIHVTGETILILMAAGEIERLVAVIPRAEEPVPGAAVAEDPTPPEMPDSVPDQGADAPDSTDAGPPRARAESADFMLEADSIDALMPDRELETVVAVGSGYAERIDPDSARMDLHPYLAKDWVRGDTIIARFTVVQPAMGTSERVLDSLTALGGLQPATSIYLVRDERGPDREPGFSYQTAHSIQVMFADGAVREVHLVGQVTGVYLQPNSAFVTPPTAGAGPGGGGGRP